MTLEEAVKIWSDCQGSPMRYCKRCCLWETFVPGKVTMAFLSISTLDGPTICDLFDDISDVLKDKQTTEL